MVLLFSDWLLVSELESSLRPLHCCRSEASLPLGGRTALSTSSSKFKLLRSTLRDHNEGQFKQHEGSPRDTCWPAKDNRVCTC